MALLTCLESQNRKRRRSVRICRIPSSSPRLPWAAGHADPFLRSTIADGLDLSTQQIPHGEECNHEGRENGDTRRFAHGGYSAVAAWACPFCPVSFVLLDRALPPAILSPRFGPHRALTCTTSRIVPFPSLPSPSLLQRRFSARTWGPLWTVNCSGEKDSRNVPDKGVYLPGRYKLNCVPEYGLRYPARIVACSPRSSQIFNTYVASANGVAPADCSHCHGFHTTCVALPERVLREPPVGPTG